MPRLALSGRGQAAGPRASSSPEKECALKKQRYTIRVALTLLAFLAAGAPTLLAAPAPNIHGETVQQVAERTGYTVEQMRTAFPPIQQWKRYDLDPPPDRMAESFAANRFGPPPAPGVHPRVFFGPDDLPEMRRRLRETHVGRLMMAGIRGRLLQASPRREDWEDVPYKPTPEQLEAYAARGLHVHPRMGYRGPWVGGWIDALAAGRVPDELAGLWTDRDPRGKRHYLMHLLPYEAFRCLIDQDAAGGRRLAAAATTIARDLQKHMDTWTGTDDWQRVYQPLSSHSLGLTYDWAHAWMTEEQRTVVRKTIAAITRGKQYLGLNQLPGFPANTSNWNIIHANLLPMILAIEGEQGYDEDVYLRIVEGLRKWVYVASGPQGAPFEGLNKSHYAPNWLVPLAKRGQPLLGTEWSKNHVRRFQLHTMLPWGGEHVFETGIGPSRDIATFKFAHPSDPVVDILYASTVRALFEKDARGPWPNIRTSYAPKWCDLFLATDPLGAKGDAYDFDAAYDRVLAHLRAREPLTYFSDYRGVLTTRSAWTRDAAFLYVEPRHVHGGHTRASRGEFVFAADGRVWARRTEAVESDSAVHSVVLIDGRGEGPFRCVPARTLAVRDAPAATFIAADLTWPYSRVTCSPGDEEAEPVPVTPNQSRLRPSPLPWMDRPWSFLPLWNSGNKPVVNGQPTYNSREHHHWKPYNPVKYAYRTAGLVRGAHPYALIVDDLRKDGQAHTYLWQMHVPDDVTLAKRTAPAPAKAGVVDLVLAEADGQRRLLVRVLAVGKAPAEAALTREQARLEVYKTERRGKTHEFPRLVVPLEGAGGTFKILLYPHRKGDALPETAWSDDGRSLAVSCGDQADTFVFKRGEDGRTRLALSQDGKTVAEMP